MTSGRPVFQQHTKRTEGSDTTHASHAQKALSAGCTSRNFDKSKKITQPSGAATPRNSDAHKRIAVPKALCVLWEHPRPSPKSGKVRRSDTRPGDVCERAERSEGSDTTPVRNTPVSPCEPLCAILLAKAGVYPPQSLETNVAVFVPEVLKAVRPMCWKRWYDCVSCAFQAFFEDEKESRIKGWRRNRRSAQSLLPAVRAVDGVSTQSVVAPFEENFRTAGVLAPANAGAPRILVVPCGRLGRKSR